MLRRPLLLALVAGLVSPDGFAPLNLWPLLLASLALLLALVHRAPNLKRAMLIGWVFGVAHFTVGNNWIQHAFDFQDKMPPVLGYFAVVLLSLYLAIYPALAAGLAWKLGRHADETRPGPVYVLAFAAAWIVTEWLRAGLFTGYPWNPLAAAWLPVPVVPHAAALVGTYALSGLTVLFSGALLLAFHRRWVPAAATAVVLPLLGLIGTVSSTEIVNTRPNDTPPPGAPQVVVVQPNIGQEGVSDPDYPERVFSTLLRLTGQPGDAPRLIVWPEGMVNYYIEPGYPADWYWQGTSEMVRRRIAAQLGPNDAALVSGNALFFAEDGYHASGAANSVFVVRSDGKLHGRYDKAHLVPYGEYLPMRGLLEPLGLARLVMGEIDFLPGPGPETLDVPGFGDIGAQVCYEIIFSGQVVDPENRPDVIFNPSNDAWFGSWGPPQHLAQARLRAIEEGLPILRATPTGISAVIDANGAVRVAIPQGEPGTIVTDMPAPHAPTLFSRLGNVMAFLIAALMAATAIAMRRLGR
ncbi:apolipoprotein N-acyltransferase [Stakelama tenebrarum]|uniref:Apolipoprotein N-acyltransferase n=1 Tax=Stakelama tenebrarum TaxID=2711215 RepID=A0A6G6Y2D3_9SPHN|nr:apolipoprotein N-acyltransferase [Sphingosinithalassobacter tenebrarum]QIG79001.1 apolipoprotein N-acyltransferase [Sphingosinithalassobacter tenebrarum]